MPADSDFGELIRRARLGDADALGRLLESQRAHLRRVADLQLSRRLAARVDGSDVVQQTFLEAQRNFARFLGRGDDELLAWLRQILAYKVAGAVRDHARLQKRDVRRERPLDAPPGDSAAPPEPAPGHSSPSQRAIRDEEAEHLARALAALPPDQSEAVRLRHLEGWSLADIAARLGRSPTATAGLIKRGVQALRKELRSGDPGPA